MPSSSTFERAEAALQAVPRARFLPPDQVAHADQDVPLPIGHGQTGSQPTTVRRMLELLDVQAGDRVLDVGAGSGWSTALLAWLTGTTGVVHGVERLPELLALASGHLARAGMPWAHLHLAAPGVLGLPALAPFDRVLVSAQPPRLPEALVDQLAPGGVLVGPVEGRMLRVVAASTGLVVEQHGWYRFVPLVTDPPTWHDQAGDQQARGGPPA